MTTLRPSPLDCNKPLPSVPATTKRTRQFLTALKRLPQALKDKRDSGYSLQRRPALRIRLERRETFVMQTSHLNPQPLPDPEYLGNRLLLGEQDRRSLARATLLHHIHPLAPIPEDLPYADVFLNRSSSTLSASPSSSCHEGASYRRPTSPLFDPTAPPRSYFSDDSSDTGDEESEGHFSCGETCDEEDFPEDEDDTLEFEDEDLTSDSELRSFVSDLEDDKRWSTLFSPLSTSTSSASSSAASSPPTSPPSTTPFHNSPPASPRSTLLPSSIPYHSPLPSTAGDAAFATFERGFRSRPLSLPFTTFYPGVGSDGSYDLDDFRIILTEEPPSPTKRGRRHSNGQRILTAEGKNKERRGSTKTI
ncbi:hypothetical protein JCM6882_006372 [Rhodosporidiobolus microsporus]